MTGFLPDLTGWDLTDDEYEQAATLADAQNPTTPDEHYLAIHDAVERLFPWCANYPPGRKAIDRYRTERNAHPDARLNWETYDLLTVGLDRAARIRALAAGLPGIVDDAITGEYVRTKPKQLPEPETNTEPQQELFADNDNTKPEGAG